MLELGARGSKGARQRHQGCEYIGGGGRHSKAQHFTPCSVCCDGPGAVGALEAASCPMSPAATSRCAPSGHRVKPDLDNGLLRATLVTPSQPMQHKVQAGGRLASGKCEARAGALACFTHLCSSRLIRALHHPDQAGARHKPRPRVSNPSWGERTV